MKNILLVVSIILGLSIQLSAQSSATRSKYTKDYKNKFYLLGGFSKLNYQNNESFSSIQGELGGIFMFQKESFSGVFGGINWTIISVDYFNKNLNGVVKTEFDSNTSNIVLGTMVGPEIIYVPLEKFAIQGGYQLGLSGYIDDSKFLKKTLLTSLSHSFHLGIKLGPILAKLRWQLLNNDDFLIEKETLRSLNVGFIF